MARANIRAIQRKVNEVSNYKLKVDGWGGKATEGAVIDLLDRLNKPIDKIEISIKSDEPNTAHFLMEEFKCRDGSAIPEKLYQNGQMLMDVVEDIRMEYDNPILIASGYRSQKYNDNLIQNRNKRKPTRSMHILFGAADIKGADGKVRQIGLIAKRLYDEGKIRGLALGLYFIHIDIRGSVSYANDNYLGFYNGIKSFTEWKRRAR